MIQGNPRGKPGLYELYAACHVNVLWASLGAGITAGIGNGVREWWHAAGPALEIVAQQLFVAGITAAGGVVMAYLKNVFSNNTGEALPGKKRPRRRR